jgi:hypothetical protein
VKNSCEKSALDLVSAMNSAALIGGVALVCLSGPMAAQAGDSDLVQSCAKSFIAEQFPNRVTSVRIESNYRGFGPLVLRATPQVTLIAREKTTGRVLATANCRSHAGEVDVLPLVPVDRI